VPKPDPFSSSLHADDVQPAPGIPAGALTELQILLAAETPREGLLIARRESELLQEGMPDWARGMQSSGSSSTNYESDMTTRAGAPHKVASASRCE
jgi:hypothetical protein